MADSTKSESRVSDNYPFYKIAAEAERLIGRGAIIFQKFTCAICGMRQTMTEPNAFFKHGKCENCGSVTNIEDAGCNYLLIWDLENRRNRNVN